MLQRIKDRFNLEGDPTDVDKAMARQFGRRLSDYRKYKKLKTTKGVEYARSHPPSGDKILEVETEHCTEAGVTPMTQEELSIKSLKAKSGYVKGLSMRPSSSLRTIVASTTNNLYVSHLESLVQEYQGGMQAQQQKIDVLSESNKQMELTTAMIIEYLKQQGNGFNEYIESSMST
ncbi:hypothetical protein RHGRI_017182 [Rhododendron griersonianum]|uniref:Transposase n=1 Tax=Rhododendron griersonianum TaxID=479676 RepID=A0AAV6JWV1_9ERIC|nr:hypothetical protein RHGRI_017182 [Rhododendron griersonianum]